MKKDKKADSKEIGLEMGLIFGKHFFKTEHMHYGYWTKGLELDLANLPEAQENHSNFLISHIPRKARNILDVGCGVGKLAEKMITKGFQVDCVSPSRALARHARELLGDRSQIYECVYEDLQTDKRYDVILFSESFQYVNMEKGFQNTLKYLNDAGYLLICDFFKTDAEGRSVLGGGHRLSRFYDLISHYPLRQLKDIDMTEQTAPNLNIVNDLLINAGLPIWNLIIQFLNSRSPFFSKILQWKFRKKIEKIHRKYFSGRRNAENFKIFKSYRLLLYQKQKG
jgi:2-polyprenyl-3-methyl-5-hydroxy-6-metoxy-1,4-benzoquinol methylase